MGCAAQFLADRSGNIGLVFALALIPVLTAAGTAVDYANATNVRTHWQTAADAAALAAAAASVSSDSERAAVARAFFPTSMAEVSPGSVQPGVSIAVNGNDVSVAVLESVPTSLLDILNIQDIPVLARATATQVFGGPLVCVLALNKTAPGAVTFAGNTSFDAENCAIYSNSSAGAGLIVQGSASVVAAGFCSAGGVSTPAGLTPTP